MNIKRYHHDRRSDINPDWLKIGDIRQRKTSVCHYIVTTGLGKRTVLSLVINNLRRQTRRLLSNMG
jgi:hypothetical protein